MITPIQSASQAPTSIEILPGTLDGLASSHKDSQTKDRSLRILKTDRTARYRGKRFIPFCMFVALLVATTSIFTATYVLSESRGAQASDFAVHDIASGTASPAFNQTQAGPPDTASSVMSNKKTNSNKVTSDRIVHFEPLTEETGGYYSGMWWMARELFVEVPLGQMKNRESVSFVPFRMVGRRRVLLSRDWLDFSVEHLSRYINNFLIRDPKGADDSLGRLAIMLTRYIDNISSKLKGADDSTHAPWATIAVVPIYADETKNESMARLITVPPSPVYPSESKIILSMYSLVVTIMSLWKAGIGRVVVMGNTRYEPVIVQAALKVVALATDDKQGLPMDLVYVYGLSDDLQSTKNMPLHAVTMLQAVFLGNATVDDTRKVLGDNPNRWKYVYFSEPDLILHTRSFVLDTITQHLDARNILAARRLQPMPHEVDFPNYGQPSRLIPAYPRLSKFVDLDPDAGDSCCDSANQTWEGLKDKTKGVRWFNEGFSRQKEPRYDETLALERHKRLLTYPFLRLTSGLNVFVLEHTGRHCIPVPRGVGCARR